MSTPRSALVRRLYELIEHAQLEECAQLCSPELSWEVAENYPHGGTVRGPDAVFGPSGFFAQLLTQFDNWDASPDEVVEAGDDLASIHR